MKNYLLFLSVFLLFLSTNQVNAQAFNKEKLHFDIGYIFSSRSITSVNIFSPGAMFTLEKGIHKWVGIGLVGGLKYQTTGKQSSSGIPPGYLTTAVGISGSFHFYQMIDDLVNADIGADKLDIAVKHTFGLGVNFVQNQPAHLYFIPGFSVSARYFFTDSFGVYLEGGYPMMGLLVGGLTFKF